MPHRAAVGRSDSANTSSRSGLQLYTVRNLMKKDFDGTIAGVAKIGYKEVEFAGYDGKTPKEVRAVLDKNGLTAPSAHIPYELDREQDGRRRWRRRMSSATNTSFARGLK